MRTPVNENLLATVGQKGNTSNGEVMDENESAVTPPPESPVEVLPSEVVSLFRSLLDQEYYEALKARLKDGIAGPVEVLVLKYAHGEPKIHHRAKEDETRFKGLRAAALKFRREHPEKAKLLDLQVQSEAAVDVTPEEPGNGDHDD